MSISETLYRAALKWVQATGDREATKVVGFSESSYDAGGCDTCGHTIVIEVHISYRTSRSRFNQSTMFKGDFTEFICELDRYDT